MIDAQQIKGGLWQGSYPIPEDGKELGRRFDVILFCAPAEHRPLPENFKPARSYYVGLRDGWRVEASEARRIVQASLLVADALSYRERVLVTCRQGANRSGVVTVGALVIRGMEINAAVRLLRQKRKIPLRDPNGKWGDDWSHHGRRNPALYNEDYVDWLRQEFWDKVTSVLFHGQVYKNQWLILSEITDGKGAHPDFDLKSWK